jgi:hypothetical protein
MKVLLKESQLNNAIERLIKNVNKDVVSIDFVETESHSIDLEKKTLTPFKRTIIRIVVDPHNILGGNIHTVKDYEYLQLRREIQKTLKRFLNIDQTKVMSPYEIEFYVIGTTKV